MVKKNGSQGAENESRVVTAVSELLFGHKILTLERLLFFFILCFTILHLHGKNWACISMIEEDCVDITNNFLKMCLVKIKPWKKIWMNYKAVCKIQLLLILNNIYPEH
jgi:hypothetical protein